MRFFLTLFITVILFSCRQDKKDPTIPKEPEVISTDQDGLRTDAVDTLVQVPEVIDSLKLLNKVDE